MDILRFRLGGAFSAVKYNPSSEQIHSEISEEEWYFQVVNDTGDISSPPPNLNWISPAPYGPTLSGQCYSPAAYHTVDFFNSAAGVDTKTNKARISGDVSMMWMTIEIVR